MSTIGEKKNALRARTMQRYYLQLVKNGFAALWGDWRTRALLVLATFSTFMLGLFISAQHTILWPLYLFDCLAGYTLLLCAAFILTSRIPNASRIIDNLLRIYSDPTASVFIVEGLFDLSDTDTEYKFYMSRAEAETYLQLRMELELEGRGFRPVEEFY